MKIDLTLHRYSATVGDWRGVFTNVALAMTTAKWNATRYETGAARIGWKEWAVVDEERQRYIAGGVGPYEHPDEQRMAG